MRFNDSFTNHSRSESVSDAAHDKLAAQSGVNKWSGNGESTLSAGFFTLIVHYTIHVNIVGRPIT